MLTFLFWNLGMNRDLDQPHQKRLIRSLIRLVRKHRIDMLLLAECSFAPDLILEALNNVETDRFEYAPGECTKIHVFTRFSNQFIKAGTEGARFTIRHLTPPGSESLTLVVAHLPSRLYWSDDSINVEASLLAQDIRNEEAKAGHQRTLLMGDLNLNPFDWGMVAAGSLHAVMSRQVATKGDREVLDRKHPFFYNPIVGSFWGGAKRAFWNVLSVEVRSRLLFLEYVRSDPRAPRPAACIPGSGCEDSNDGWKTPFLERRRYA